MNWYTVVKTIKGRRYLYWQKTYRVGRHVKTVNKYIGPVGTAIGRPPASRPTIINPAYINPSKYIPKAAEYVKEWGEYEFKNKEDAELYAHQLEKGEGGQWEAKEIRTGAWRAHRILEPATTIPIPFPIHLNKSVVEFAIKALTGDVSTTDMDQAWRVKSVNAEIEHKSFPKVEEALQRIGVVVKHDDLSGNYFSPSDNFINIIPKKCWYATKGNTDIYRYYRTVCHELVHWTGHESRLNRIDFRSWGDKRYALEELTAEMGSVMLLKALGYQEGESTEYHAAYFSSWMDRFTGNEKQEVIEQAKQRATKAVEYILEHGGVL